MRVEILDEEAVELIKLILLFASSDEADIINWEIIDGLIKKMENINST